MQRASSPIDCKGYVGIANALVVCVHLVYRMGFDEKCSDDNSHCHESNTTKTCHLLSHCNLRQPDTVQSLSALLSSPVPSLNSLSLSVAILDRFYCLYVTLCCDLEFWPCNLDLWPLTLNMCSRRASPRSNSVQNLSKIEQSAAELLRFEYLTLWPWTYILSLIHIWRCRRRG